MEKENVPSAILTLTAGAAITLFSLWYGQNHGLMPEQVSEQAPLVDDFFNVMMTIGTALFLIVEGTILIAAIKYRQRPGDNTDAEPIKGNFSLEAFWTAIPAIIVIGLGIYSVEVYTNMGGFELAGAHNHQMAHSHSMAEVASLPGSAMAAPLIADAAEEETVEATKNGYGFGAAPVRESDAPDLVVNVNGIQFAWLFNYPETNIVAGELHVPVGKDVQLNIAATDVIHSFWVPQFRLKQDAIPGKNTELRFVATKTGTYPIVCAELCGGYHGAMRTQLYVHTQEEYDAWVAENTFAAAENPILAQANPEANLKATVAQEFGVDAHTLAQLHH